MEGLGIVALKPEFALQRLQAPRDLLQADQVPPAHLNLQVQDLNSAGHFWHGEKKHLETQFCTGVGRGE